jgi:hypothetical protein
LVLPTPLVENDNAATETANTAHDQIDGVTVTASISQRNGKSAATTAIARRTSLRLACLLRYRRRASQRNAEKWRADCAEGQDRDQNDYQLNHDV